MKKQRILNIISLIFNICIVLFTVYAISWNFRNDIIREDDWFGFSGFKCLRFFTNLSNIFVAIAAFILIIYNIKNLINDECNYPNWALKLKFTATVAVTVTFVTVIVFLSPMVAIYGKNVWALYNKNNFFLHVLTPILAIISFVLCEKIKNFKLKDTLLGIIPVFLYSILYITMVVFVGEANGGWTDFYGFTFGGTSWAAFISAVVMLSATFGLSVSIYAIQKRIHKNDDKDSSLN